ncbi:helix-hairpin-helix domain-containing protein [Nocardioides marmoraquaticus]
MRKSPPDEVVAAARRRLELLGRELDQAGLARLPDAPPPAEVPPDPLPPPGVVHPSGRHAAARPARPGLGERVAGLVPDSFRGAVALERGALVVVLVLALLGAGAAPYAVTRDAGTSTPAPPATVASAEPLVEAAPSTQPTATPSAGTVTVHVAGKVRRPGVLELPTGSRVDDAVRQAGGARRGTDLSGLNLARVLVDGEQVLVGVVGPVPGAAASAAEQAPGSAAALVSLNTATLDQLDTLPGVGPVTAQKILDWREANGAFSAVEELLEVDGIGDKTLAEIAPHVTL